MVDNSERGELLDIVARAARQEMTMQETGAPSNPGTLGNGFQSTCLTPRA